MAQVNVIKRVTTSALIQAGECVLASMYVNSTSSGTIKLYNVATATTVGADLINNTITPAAGFHFLGNVLFTAGVYVETGATIDVTFHLLSENR